MCEMDRETKALVVRAVITEANQLDTWYLCEDELHKALGMTPTTKVPEYMKEVFREQIKRLRAVPDILYSEPEIRFIDTSPIKFTGK